MKGVIKCVALFLLIAVATGENRTQKAGRRFPNDFLFGSSTAAYQVEGAWNVHGKGQSIWDTATHRKPNGVADGSTGDDAAKSYYYYKDDVAALKEIGMNFYRFSIAWTRVLPNGDFSVIREEGLQYYDNLINELLANGIEPMVTMYHWDLPQKLQDLGGWTNPLIADYFVEYARLLFDRYANRVKYWNTFNEPLVICQGGYGEPWSAPFIRQPGIGNYLCAHNVLISHAKAYHLYREKYYQRYNAKISMAISCYYAFPKNPNKAGDWAAADRIVQYECGWYAHPIFSQKGGYPDVMVDTIGRKSREEGRKWSRLPHMSDELKAYIKGTADFLAINYYSSMLAEQPWDYGQPQSWTSYYADRESSTSHNSTWPRAKSSWLYSVPEGFRGLLNWFKREYNNPDVYITENGWSDDGQLNDVGRQNYYKSHLNAVLDAIYLDGCNVKAHTSWSIIDNFEWMMGYTERFGLYHIDYNDPRRKRTPKDSSKMLKQIIRNRALP